MFGLPTWAATRTALITGRYQYRLPVGLEEPINATTPRNIGLPPSHPTLPSLLRTAGYRTALVGKWHLGTLPDFSPNKSGYEHFFGIFAGAADYFNHGADASRNGVNAGRLYEEEVPVERHGYMTNLLGDRAVQTIEGHAASKEPFLLSLHFTAPHWPWEGPDDEAESKRIRDITSEPPKRCGFSKEESAMTSPVSRFRSRTIIVVVPRSIARP